MAPRMAGRCNDAGPACAGSTKFLRPDVFARFSVAAPIPTLSPAAKADRTAITVVEALFSDRGRRRDSLGNYLRGIRTA